MALASDIAESIFGPSTASQVAEAQYKRDRYLRDQMNAMKRQYEQECGIPDYMYGHPAQDKSKPAYYPEVSLQDHGKVKLNKKLLLCTSN